MGIPFCVYSDGPRLPTGLARITRDLCQRLWAERDSLGIDLLQVGYDPLPGPAVAWPLFSGAKLDTEDTWGATMVVALGYVQGNVQNSALSDASAAGKKPNPAGIGF